MDPSDTIEIALSPEEADIILAHLGPPTGEPTTAEQPGEPDDNPVLIDGEEDEHIRSCGTLKRIRLATGEPETTSSSHLPNPLGRPPGGKKLHRPAQLIQLEKKLRLRLPKGPCKLSPQLSRSAALGKPFWTDPPVITLDGDPLNPVPTRDRVVNVSEDDPHPLTSPTRTSQGEQSEATPHHSPFPSLIDTLLNAGSAGASEATPHPPVPRSLPYLCGEESEATPHHSPIPSFLTPNLDTGSAEASEATPHPPVPRSLPSLYGEQSEATPHHSPFPSLPLDSTNLTDEKVGRPPQTKNPVSAKPVRRRKTRRAGRRNQLRRLLGQFFHTPGDTSHSPLSSNGNNQNNSNNTNDRGNHNIPQVDSQGVSTGKKKLKIVSTEILNVPPYKIKSRINWALIPISVDPVIYSADIPAGDPRRDIYIQKRAKALYPLSGPH